MNRADRDPEILQHSELEGGPFFWQAGNVGVLLLHGLTATTAEVRPFAKFLYHLGFTVTGPLLPGHGTTPQDLNRQKWQNWAASADDAYQALYLHCNKVFVVGESMGGLLALYLASKYPDIAGILLFAPAYHISGIERARFLAPFVPFIRKKGGDNTLAWQGYYVNPTRAAAQLYKLQREVAKQLPKITQPVLIVQGKLDQTIDPLSSQMIYDQIGSREKNLNWFDQSSHVVLLDKEFQKAADLSLQFINSEMKD